MNKNSLKGNAAEYLVLHHLLKERIPAWQTGGNNRKWDLIIEVSPENFQFASVKYASTRMPIFNANDEKISKGIYFIVVPEGKMGAMTILLFGAKRVAEACIQYRKKAMKTPSYKRRRHFRAFRIDKDELLVGQKNFRQYLKKWSREL